MTRDAMEWSDGPGTILGTWTTVSREKVSLVRRRDNLRRPVRDGRLRDVSGWDRTWSLSHPFTAWDILGSGTRPWDRADG
jgi:hypothetical protein